MSFDGAAFRLCDFQLHTPRDRSWDGERPGEGLTDPDEIETARGRWAANLVQECLNRGVGAVAVTDHHECVLAWYVIEAAKDTALWVFPGMELTAKDSAQAIVLFDADIDRPWLEKARSLLRLPANCDPGALNGIEVELLDDNIADLQAVLSADPELRDRFIVLPNVTPGGHKTVLRRGFHKRFNELPYVGGYLDKKRPSDLSPGDLAILEGSIPAWTSERRGVVRTSDCRTATYAGIGELGTWIKLAAPTAEALRQAMLAADSRIRYETPLTPSIVLRSLSVAGAKNLTDQTIHFSDQLNAAIGGRGAGKSTLLEFVRFALGRSALDEEHEEWDPTHERRRELLENAFNAGGSASVVAHVDGAEMTLTRTAAAHDAIELSIDGEKQVLAPRDIRALVSAQVFSQGALSHLGRVEAEERLRAIITAPHREFLTEINAEVAASNAELGRQLARLQEGWIAAEELRVSRARAAAVQARIEALRETITEQDQSVRDALAKHEVFLSLKRVMEQTRATSEKLSSPELDVAILVEDLDDLAKDWEKIELEEVDATVAAVREASALMALGGRALEEGSAGAQGRLDPLLMRWRDAEREHQLAYAPATTAEQSTRARVSQLTQLQEQRAALQDRIGTLTAQANEVDEALLAFWDTWQKVSHGLEARRDGLIAAAASVEPLSNGLARADVLETGSTTVFEEALRALLEGTYVREGRIDDLCARLAASDAGREEHRKLVADLLAILKWSIQGGDGNQERPDTSFLVAHLEGGADRLYERISPERALPVMKADGYPRLSVLHRKGNSEIEFSRASQGERATTLLTVLMNQDAGPLIVDQPEEDLDNKVIGEIVAAIRRAKDRRQMILATHNANLVVNGDAELVMTLEAGVLESIGAIDHSAVRDSITGTMEGGKAAFELRRKKYNF